MKGEAAPTTPKMMASHGEGYTGAEECITLHELGGFVPSVERLGGWIRSCWRGFVSNLAKNRIRKGFRIETCPKQKP
jgi:hypothetical protein